MDFIVDKAKARFSSQKSDVGAKHLGDNLSMKPKVYSPNASPSSSFQTDPKGLTGRCDFIISYSPKQLEVTTPVMALVEAKNDNIKSGIAQCIAEMVAAQLFNERKQNQIPCIYGVITTGSNWKFLRLVENRVALEAVEHFIGDLDTLFGILLDMIETAHPLNGT